MMQIYQPIDPGIPLKSSQSDLVGLRWRPAGIYADFLIPNDSTRLLRVSFDAQCIVRLLDEMPLSTEDVGLAIGLVADHFSYRLANTAFEAMQSTAWKEVAGPVAHYQFVTGSGCMDVLSAAQPLFSLVARSDNAEE